MVPASRRQYYAVTYSHHARLRVWALAAPVKHPNLLLNRDEIEQVKAKIAKYPWAAAVLEKTRQDCACALRKASSGIESQVLPPVWPKYSIALPGENTPPDRGESEA